MRLITIHRVACLGLALATSTTASVILSSDSRSLLSKSQDLILKRDDPNAGCAALGLSSDYQACGQGLPSNFCCDAKNGFTCKAFNNNQSAICCPAGQDCKSFAQVACNPQGLNVSAPQSGAANLHSTLITGGLVICQDKCCPVGYACSTDSSNTCILSNGTAGSATAAGPGTGASSPAATLSNQPAAGVNPNQNPNNPDPSVTDSNQCQAYPATAVLVGLFPGIIAGLILAVMLAMCLSCCRARREKKGARGGSGGGGGGEKAVGGSHVRSSSEAPLTRNTAHGPVSEPIFHDTGATRVDFLRRMSRGGVAASPSQRSARVRGLFSSANTPKTPKTPKTPRRQSSTESIVIFSPPEARMGSDSGLGSSTGGPASVATRDTRWEDVMTGAKGLGVKGLAAPPAFLGSPSIVDGRRKALDGTTRMR